MASTGEFPFTGTATEPPLIITPLSLSLSSTQIAFIAAQGALDKQKLLKLWIDCGAVRDITLKGFGHKKAVHECRLFQALYGKWLSSRITGSISFHLTNQLPCSFPCRGLVTRGRRQFHGHHEHLPEAGQGTVSLPTTSHAADPFRFNLHPCPNVRRVRSLCTLPTLHLSLDNKQSAEYTLSFYSCLPLILRLLTF